MAVDAISGGDVDSSATVTSTEPFDVDIVVTAAPNAYEAEQYQLEWDPALLAYDSETPTLLDGLTLCGSPTVGVSMVYNGCASEAPTTATGAVHTVTLHCVGDGTSPLHLVTMVEDPTFGTTTYLAPGEIIETALTDALATCSLTTPTPTPTPPPTPALDSDGDGCSDVEELGDNPTLGGTRDPLNPWDFYDVPVPTAFNGGTLEDRDKAVSILNDVLAVLEYSGTSDGGLCNSGPDGTPGNADDRCYDQDNNSDGEDDGLLYDRSPGAVWSDAPDGAITINEDVLLVLAQSGQSCQAAAALAGIYSVPSSLPGIVPAIAPASAPGNVAVAVAVCDDPDPFNPGLCPPSLDPPTRALTFTLTRAFPDGDPAARFAASGSTTLVCEEGEPCDVDTAYGLFNREPDGHVAVEVQGSGENEVVEVQACDQTGDCVNTRIIFVETIFAVSPLQAAGFFSPTLVSYACPMRAQVPVGPGGSDWGGIDGLADLQDTTGRIILAFAAVGIVPTNRLSGSGFALPPDYGPKWRCGTAPDSPQNRVRFETDAGILSVEAFVNPITIGDGCDSGESVDVIDYPGIPDWPVFVGGTGPADNQCDLDAFDAVVTYGLEQIGDIWVATVSGQQLGGGGPLRTIQVTFPGGPTPTPTPTPGA
ncbi:MAG: flexitail domain-containing putative surface protein [Dehalococcoidia bacterium]